MTDIGLKVRGAIPVPTSSLRAEHFPPSAGRSGALAVQGPRRESSQRAPHEPLSIHHFPRQAYTSAMNISHARVSEPLLIGIPQGLGPVDPRPMTYGTGIPRAQSPNDRSPVHNITTSPLPSVGNTPSSKSTNFHNIADLIGGCKSPEPISPNKHDCLKQQTTPTSNPRQGDSSDDYIDVVENDKTTSPNLRFSSEPHPTNSAVPKSSSSDQKAEETSPTSTEANRARKGRTIYKAQQVYVLEEIFRRTHYPDPEVIETLSRDLDISENKIKVWFQNKRARWRRRAAETGHPVLPSLGYSPVAPPGGVPGWHHPPPGGLHPHPTPTGAVLMPHPMYPGLQGTHPLPLSQHPSSLSILPQLQSFYSMEQGFLNLKGGLNGFPKLHHDIGMHPMQMWQETSKLSSHSS